MAPLTQTDVVAELTTPLGKDKLVLTQFTGVEGLGELFEFQIDALSEQGDINFDAALGKSCTIKLKAYKGKFRFFDGILTRAQWVGKTDDFFHYRLVLRPWFYLLGYKADCRIFLDKKVKDIIEEVFTKGGFPDFEFRLTADYDKIPYCVQYRESDLAFCSRLMELYGIYYFFEHREGKHTMVMADARSSHRKNPDVPTLPYLPLQGTELHLDQLLGAWVSERRFRTGKIEFNDYDPTKPSKKLRAPNEGSERYQHSKLEVYDYPGKYDELSKGNKFSKFRLEAEQSFDHRRYVDGDAASLFPGTLFTVERHPIASENREFLAVRCSHRYGTQHYRTGFGGGAPEEQVYYGNYELQPSDRPFRMLPVTPKPVICGIQTAKVVGKKGEESEEISTDEDAHIWVQFFWDREPQKSCPIRVAHAWSGKKWGTQFIPRVGMEVVVEFLEGDPDRPLVTGCVYNGDNKVPYNLPGKKTQSGTKSESSKGDHGYNEFMFEDKKGGEFIRMHAQADHLVTINANQTGTVGVVKLDSPALGGDQTWTVGGNRSWTIQKGNDTVELLLGNQTITLDIGQQTVDAMMGINLTVCFGMSSIQITPASISMLSPVININGEAAVNIMAPAVNIGATLNTPLLVAGAAVVSGIPL
ncbi:Actin cross-linking toxin VgrG1 [Bradyrhizobium ivorense]|uniref:Actin cross-linking toxin VgrG1 n=1 Tax=Bradyrhizobium ivorense TaxID=2511166 RepID=A0A508TPV5_9BRAD|nr:MULTISPECIES: type VI secretion system tip protein TssI/VgrG [Bradyrhizobium]MCC8936307.1 type VI secretion system tip protein VgrG [Bradyrhizobium ivorense]QOZ27447.1 type VI secretion system tip protein VgrG [Bradyrhizobium sp. CCBAU 51753]VIO76370.1 Actin cross-linking toxin VgrG1 [Bradyrhizobium ivorense]